MEEKTKENAYLMPISIILASLMIAIAWVYSAGKQASGRSTVNEEKGKVLAITEKIPASSADVVLPVVWDDLGKKLIESGVVDANKFEELYATKGGLTPDIKKLLYQDGNRKIVVNEGNSGIVLNLLWAFGLSNKNEILEKGPMVDSRYGGAGNFASTGGWTLADGSAMDHYSKHDFVTLTSEQQGLVERVSKNIYRPCCDNSTYFPDCNHGMAMLGLLELMAANSVGESEMYRIALAINSLWFPGAYDTIKGFFSSEGMDWSSVDPKEILGENYSSVSGFRQIMTRVKSSEKGNGSSCGV